MCSAALVPMLLPRRDEGSGKLCTVIEPYSILAPTQNSNPAGRIQNHERRPLHYHCTLYITWLISSGEGDAQIEVAIFRI